MGIVHVCSVCHESYDEHVACSCPARSELAWMNEFVPAQRGISPYAHMGAVEMGG